MRYVDARGAAADYEGVGLEGHGGEELLAGGFDEDAGYGAGEGVEFGGVEEAGEFVCVGGLVVLVMCKRGRGRKGGGGTHAEINVR